MKLPYRPERAALELVSAHESSPTRAHFRVTVCRRFPLPEKTYSSTEVVMNYRPDNHAYHRQELLEKIERYFSAEGTDETFVELLTPHVQIPFSFVPDGMLSPEFQTPVCDGLQVHMSWNLDGALVACAVTHPDPMGPVDPFDLVELLDKNGFILS